MEDFVKGFLKGLTFQLPWYYYAVCSVIFILIAVIRHQIKDNKQQRLKNSDDKNSLIKADLNTLEANNMTVDDKISKIEKLGKLKQAGLLTDEEFQSEKRKILSK